MSADLVFHAVSHRYGRHSALENFSVCCVAGNVTCLIGPNGAGKSTALALAAGLLPLASGQITFGPYPVTPVSLPRSSGYLAQQSAFPAALRVREVVEFARRARRTPDGYGAEVAAVTGIDAVWSLQVGQLSGGWVRRLGLAVALVPPADLLLLDEPFVGLDPETLDRVVAYLRRRANAGTAIVMASHDFEVIDLLDARVIVLDEGRLLANVPAGEGSCARSIYRSVLMGRAAEQERIAHAS